jgi:hypothetical protein
MPSAWIKERPATPRQVSIELSDDRRAHAHITAYHYGRHLPVDQQIRACPEVQPLLHTERSARPRNDGRSGGGACTGVALRANPIISTVQRRDQG